MKNAKIVETEVVENVVINVERVTEITYNALKGANVDMTNYAITNTRVKTEHKLTELERINPEMYEAFLDMNAIHKSENARGKVQFTTEKGEKRNMWLAFTLKTEAV